jgi:hypothetical protein
MARASRSDPSPRCVFCRMPSTSRYLKLPLCEICRDQLYDFVWASGVQGAIAIVGGLSGFFFVVEEILLFTVLVMVKHRVQRRSRPRP